MTDGGVQVSVQWALEGKWLDGEGYRVLSCSTGDLDRANFADALSRFQPGELRSLPQVSVSFARLGSVSYLALALHWHATEGQRHADGVVPRDDQGRLTAYTSYFCLPYQELARGAVGYLALYRALSAITLPASDGPPVEVPVAVPASRIPAASDLAVRVAPLLLTGRSVCVLGAENSTVLERLEFIDTVMGLLPYGFRSRMAAATWTAAANRTHKFRLFFSSAPRTGRPDHVVAWDGDPSQMPDPEGDAGDYSGWLQGGLSALTRLAGLTTELKFSPRNTLQVLEYVLGARFQQRPQTGGLMVPSNFGQPLPPSREERFGGDDILGVLTDCGTHLERPDSASLRFDLGVLKRIPLDGISGESRARYRDAVATQGLLRTVIPRSDRLMGKFYEALLPVAFGAPVSLAAYQQIEECAGVRSGDPLPPGLLAAVAGAGLDGPAVAAVVHWQLEKSDPKGFHRWLTSGKVDPGQLIGALARERMTPQHAQIVCETMLSYLNQATGHYSPEEIWKALRQHGFLSRALQVYYPHSNQFQLDTLHLLLKVAYPAVAAAPGRDLSRENIQQILCEPLDPPTPALFGAVLLLLQTPGAKQIAWHAYVHGVVNRANFSRTALAALRDCLPQLDSFTANTPPPGPDQTLVYPSLAAIESPPAQTPEATYRRGL